MFRGYVATIYGPDFRVGQVTRSRERSGVLEGHPICIYVYEFTHPPFGYYDKYT